MEVLIITIRHEIYNSTIEVGFLSCGIQYEISSAFPRGSLPPSLFTRFIDLLLLTIPQLILSNRLISSLPQSLV